MAYSAQGFSIVQVDSAHSQNVAILTQENAYIKAVWTTLRMRLERKGDTSCQILTTSLRTLRFCWIDHKTGDPFAAKSCVFCFR